MKGKVIRILGDNLGIVLSSLDDKGVLKTKWKRLINQELLFMKL